LPWGRTPSILRHARSSSDYPVFDHRPHPGGEHRALSLMRLGVRRKPGPRQDTKLTFPIFHEGRSHSDGARTHDEMSAPTAAPLGRRRPADTIIHPFIFNNDHGENRTAWIRLKRGVPRIGMPSLGCSPPMDRIPGDEPQLLSGQTTRFVTALAGVDHHPSSLSANFLRASILSDSFSPSGRSS